MFVFNVILIYKWGRFSSIVFNVIFVDVICNHINVMSVCNVMCECGRFGFNFNVIFVAVITNHINVMFVFNVIFIILIYKWGRFSLIVFNVIFVDVICNHINVMSVCNVMCEWGRFGLLSTIWVGAVSVSIMIVEAVSVRPIRAYNNRVPILRAPARQPRFGSSMQYCIRSLISITNVQKYCKRAKVRAWLLLWHFQTIWIENICLPFIEVHRSNQQKLFHFAHRGFSYFLISTKNSMNDGQM